LDKCFGDDYVRDESTFVGLAEGFVHVASRGTRLLIRLGISPVTVKGIRRGMREREGELTIVSLGLRR
jgi:hypothetical protein